MEIGFTPVIWSRLKTFLFDLITAHFRIRAAAWRLHDTVEKSDVTMSDISREFSGFVASMVDAVTSASRKTREQRKSATYRRVKEQGGHAVVLKLADRIAHVEEAIQAAILKNAGKLSMYEGEYCEFRDALYEVGNADAMWAHLDALNEIGTEALNRRRLATFANRLLSFNPPRMLEVAASVSHPSRE